MVARVVWDDQVAGSNPVTPIPTFPNPLLFKEGAFVYSHPLRREGRGRGFMQNRRGRYARNAGNRHRWRSVGMQVHSQPKNRAATKRRFHRTSRSALRPVSESRRGQQRLLRHRLMGASDEAIALLLEADSYPGGFPRSSRFQLQGKRQHFPFRLEVGATDFMHNGDLAAVREFRTVDTLCPNFAGQRRSIHYLKSILGK